MWVKVGGRRTAIVEIRIQAVEGGAEGRGR